MTRVWYLDVLAVQQPMDPDRWANYRQNRLYFRAFRRLPLCTGK